MTELGPEAENGAGTERAGTAGAGAGRAGTAVRRGLVSRRLLLGAAGGAVLAAGCKPDGDSRGAHSAGETESGRRGGGSGGGPSGVLGANFNEDPKGVTFSALEGVRAGWLRGFVPMPEVKEAGDAAEQRAIRTLLEAHDRGYGTVLSLKFPFQKEPIPTPGSRQMDAQLALVDRVLKVVLDKVDVLAIGNEPFLETREQDRGPKLNAFYEHVAKHVIAYRKNHSGARSATRLYMGALNHLDKPGGRTSATDRWMSFARETLEIEGVDIHPHVASPDGVRKYLDYVVPRLRHDQTFLVTEFSLVQLWKQHMTDSVPARFARRYHLPTDTPVWKVLNDAAEHPFSARKWQDFLSMAPWFESHKHFVRNQMQRFRNTGRLAVATYGVVQGAAMVRGIDAKKTPWLLNSAYASRTVEHTDRELPRNYTVFDDFRDVQRAQDRRPVRLAKTST